MNRLALVLTIAIAVPTFAAEPSKQTPNEPILEPVRVVQRGTAAFDIVDGKKIQYRVGDRVVETAGGEVCFAQMTQRPNVSFRNHTTTPWTIHLAPSDAKKNQPPALTCARNLKELQDADLCDRSRNDSTDCVTSGPKLGACFGPECDATRAVCNAEAFTGSPDNRICTVTVTKVLEALSTARCGLLKEVDPRSLTNAIAPQTGINATYTQKIVGRPTEVQGSVPRVSFPPERLATAPYRFRLVEVSTNPDKTPEVLDLTLTQRPANENTEGCISLGVESTTTSRVAVVPLDDTGVGSWVYLNPRNPACLTCSNPSLPALAFVNRTTDRVFSVSIELPAAVQPAAPPGDGCVPAKACKISRIVQPSTPAIFEPGLLALVPEGTLLKFQVAFFDETDKPSNGFAYLRIGGVREKVNEPASELQTGFVAAVGGSLDPFISASGAPDEFVDKETKNADGSVTPDLPDGKDDKTSYIACYTPTSEKPYSKDGEPALCRDLRLYTGKYARHYTGLARIELSRALGSRADFNAVVNYRTSDLGVDDGNVVKLSEYGVNVYGLNALSLRFGRTTWANPAGGIAIFEKGDGYRFAYKYFSLAHIIKRESDKPPANHDNDDHRSIVGQMKALPIRFSNTPLLRGVKLADVTAVYGEDKRTHKYRTYGGELFYAYTNLGCDRKAKGLTGDEKEEALAECMLPLDEGEKRRNWGTIAGSLGAFMSTKHSTVSTFTGPRHGEGWVGLATATWTPTTQLNAAGVTEAVRSYQLQFGKGSSDDPDTPDTREDYIGESGAFSAGTLLMSTFQSKIDAKDRVIIGPSLANKTMIGAQVVWNTWSPLLLLAQAFNVAGDVVGRSMTIRVRQYTFGRPQYEGVSGRDAVREYSTEFLIEVPRGVKVTLGGSYMQSGKALVPVLADDAWAIVSSISLRI